MSNQTNSDILGALSARYVGNRVRLKDSLTHYYVQAVMIDADGDRMLILDDWGDTFSVVEADVEEVIATDKEGK